MSNNFFSWCLPQIKDQPRDLGFGQVLFSLMFMPLTRRLTIVIFKAQHLKPAKEGFPGQKNFATLFSWEIYFNINWFTISLFQIKRGGEGGCWMKALLSLVSSGVPVSRCILCYSKKKGTNFSVALSEGILSFFFFSHLCWGCND